ncbi:MAG: class I SAM-dependent methyltransferase [Methermicoccaceae archaeon]
MKKKAMGIRVERQSAEHMRRLLIRKGLLERSLKPFSDGKWVCFPVVDAPEGMEVEEFEFEKRAARVPMLKGVSFDVLGDVALVELSDAPRAADFERAQMLLAHHPHLRAVYGKRGVFGEFRIPSLVHLAGEGKTRTLHRENGCTFEVDIRAAYFNPRLATERARVEAKIGKSDTVFDMFAGVGPFSILVAKRSRTREVYAAEKNPVACELLRANIRRNRVENVHVFEGDVREHPKICAHAIIMNLPHSAPSFLDVALKSAAQDAHIFCYIISPKTQLKEDAARMCSGYPCVLEGVHIVKSYAPGVVMACVELVVGEKC